MNVGSENEVMSIDDALSRGTALRKDSVKNPDIREGTAIKIGSCTMAMLADAP
jgi:hypothetical protein